MPEVRTADDIIPVTAGTDLRTQGVPLELLMGFFVETGGVLQGRTAAGETRTLNVEDRENVYVRFTKFDSPQTTATGIRALVRGV